MAHCQLPPIVKVCECCHITLMTSFRVNLCAMSLFIVQYQITSYTNPEQYQLSITRLYSVQYIKNNYADQKKTLDINQGDNTYLE